MQNAFNEFKVVAKDTPELLLPAYDPEERGTLGSVHYTFVV